MKIRRIFGASLCVLVFSSTLIMGCCNPNVETVKTLQSEHKLETVCKTEENVSMTENNSENEISECTDTSKECEVRSIYAIKNQELYENLNELDKSDLARWYTDYKELVEAYSEWYERPETIYEHFDESEIYLIQRCVETETCGQDFESKVHVANVIFNRYQNECFPNDIVQVITSPMQFAYWRTKISESTILAVEFAYEIGDLTNGSLFFHSNRYSATFNNADYMFTDAAGHHFYKIKDKDETQADVE